MRWVRNISIRKKLMAIILCVSGAALLLSTVVLTFYEAKRERAIMRRDLEVTAEMIGTNSTAALAFHDQVAAVDCVMTAEQIVGLNGLCAPPAARGLFFLIVCRGVPFHVELNTVHATE